MASQPSDAFPPSARSWLAVARDGTPEQRHELAASLTAVYRDPLVRYLQAFGDPLGRKDAAQRIQQQPAHARRHMARRFDGNAQRGCAVARGS